jgi:hypothetical protein
LGAILLLQLQVDYAPIMRGAFYISTSASPALSGGRCYSFA